MLMQVLELPRDVIDMPLERHDLLDEVLLLLVHLSYLVRRRTDVFLSVLQLDVEVLVFGG